MTASGSSRPTRFLLLLFSSPVGHPKPAQIHSPPWTVSVPGFPTNRPRHFGCGLKVYGRHHPPPRAHNGLQCQTGRGLLLDASPISAALLFDYCIANFSLGFCDIPLLFRVNKSGRDTPRPDRYIVLLTGIIEYRLRWHLTELIFQKH